ncbi:hypothetical protein FHR71_002821 [Methylobacterium sp. RAS18]|nr:hypothetical protein [Methylobacterium sp. RAS18]
MSIDAAYIERCRSEIASTAQGMLNGDCSYIEGSRRILQSLKGAGISDRQKPFLVFASIDSETDAIPVGKQLEHWSDTSIARFRPDWDAAEAWAQKHGEAACREAISWLESNPANFR